MLNMMTRTDLVCCCNRHWVDVNLQLLPPCLLQLRVKRATPESFPCSATFTLRLTFMLLLKNHFARLIIIVV